MSSVDSSLLDKVLRSLRAPHTDEPERSAGELLTASAAAYGARPSDEEHTAPTGFDPMAAVLFESIVESAFLVANADNEFDERERAVLVAVVEAGSAGSVTGRQVEALLADLAEQLEEDGAEARIAWVARMVRKPEQKADVLRIAAVLAHASAGVSEVERDTLLKLGQAMGIEGAAVDQALADAAAALALAAVFFPSRACLPVRAGPCDAALGHPRVGAVPTPPTEISSVPRARAPPRLFLSTAPTRCSSAPPVSPHDRPSFPQRRFRARRPPRAP